VKQFKVRHLQQESLISSAQVQMAQHIQLLNILHSLIISSDEDMVHISKDTLADLSRHLQQTHETIEFLQLESQLQRIELQEKRDTFKFLNHPDNKSFIQPTSSVAAVPDPISSKPIIRPWEDIQNNKNRRDLGYVKDDTNLHIPDYFKPIKFISAGFLTQLTSASFEQVADNQQCMQPKVAEKENSTQPELEVTPKCSHCQRTGHMEDQCFDLHPCRHCDKPNHSLEKCRKQRQTARLKIHYEWIDPWKWSSTVKILSQFYNRIQSHFVQPTVKR